MYNDDQIPLCIAASSISLSYLASWQWFHTAACRPNSQIFVTSCTLIIPVECCPRIPDPQEPPNENSISLEAHKVLDYAQIFVSQPLLNRPLLFKFITGDWLSFSLFLWFTVEQWKICLNHFLLSDSDSAKFQTNLFIWFLNWVR